MLKKTFLELISNYTINKSLITNIWNEIEQNYSSKDRYYHTLKHLENLLLQITEVKNDIKDWNTILFTLFYHDIIYNVRNSDNEEQSAILLKKRMEELNVPENIIKNCTNQILATKKHLKNPDNDTNLFLDADLSILGMKWDIYFNYIHNIRQEYSIFPDKIYYLGRKKVIKHFLKMENIFKTHYFYNMLEKQAKNNLQKELEIY